MLAPLVEAGFAIIAYDARGHGRSGPPSLHLRSYVRNFNDLVVDLIEFTAQHVRCVRSTGVVCLAAR